MRSIAEIKTDMRGNIAYGNGRTGDVVHSECWDAYIDKRRPYDAQGRPLPYGVMATLYLQGAEKRELKHKHCAHCLKPFNAAPALERKQ